MIPPVQDLDLSVEGISGILGSISIACWIVVFSPQVLENWRRGSADGLSLLFLIAWLAGDFANVIGCVFQGVLPTMIILAVYYTIADVILLGQCFYYRGFTWSDKALGSENQADVETEASTLLHRPEHDRRLSRSSFISSQNVDGTHLSPVTPLLDDPKPLDIPASGNFKSTSVIKAIFLNILSIVVVCIAGVLGWWLSNKFANKYNGKDGGRHIQEDQESKLAFSVWGQIFGYICAILYLGSRIPQLLLNYRRKSTEGIAILFFLFACVGNLTYVLSIAAFSPKCRHLRHCREGEAAAIYGRYILVNLSWILGSLGTLLLDLAIFVQFFRYRGRDKSLEEETAIVDDAGPT